MRQRESGFVARPPDVVWRWLTDPDLIARWNPKLEATGAPPPESLRVGGSFGVRYRMSKRAVEAQASVEVCTPPRELAIRYRMAGEAWARESALLEAEGGGTRLTRTVEIRDPRLPGWARLLAGFLMRYGRPPTNADGSPGESTVDVIGRVIAEEDGYTASLD